MDEELKKEILRKTFHLFTGSVFAALIYFKVALAWHFLALFAFLSLSMVYVWKAKKRVPVLSEFINKIGREKEFPGLGAMTFIFGTFLASLFFSTDIAAASVLILAVGDAVSPIIGMHFGRTKTIFSKRKLFEGFLVGVILSFLAAAPIVGVKPAFFGSLISLFAEFWDETDFIDDNILIPLVAGTVMTVFNIYF